jgi:pullulanase/glycogen debranching enzyme
MPSPEVGNEFEFTMGSPFPLGAALQRGSANFAVFSKHATAVTLVLFRDDSSGVVSELTCHDGFTLNDIVSFNQKHNEANGSGNRDGTDCNWSWNCGIEGPTDNRQVIRLRQQQAKNLAALLLLAHGVPLILAGDELRRSQTGNNNAYCQDNCASWLDWGLEQANPDMLRFFRLLIAFRKRHSCLRPRSFEQGPKVEWHGVHIGAPDWFYKGRSQEKTLLLRPEFFLLLSPLDRASSVLTYRAMCSVAGPCAPVNWVLSISGFHRFFATKPVSSETNKAERWSNLATIVLFGTRGP